MTDALPRLDGAFDETSRRTLDRRQLIRAGAWAAPVIVLATAAPAAANMSGNGSGSGTTTTVTKATIKASAPGARVGEPGVVWIDYAAVQYDYKKVGSLWCDSTDYGAANCDGHLAREPTQSRWQPVWTLPLGTDATGAPLLSRTDALGPYDSGSVGGVQLKDVPAGVYAAVIEVVSVIYAPPTAAGVTFATSPCFSDESSTLTVAPKPVSATMTYPAGGRKVRVEFSGIPGTVVTITTANTWNMSWITKLPETVTIGANGHIDAVGVSDAAGGANINLSAPIGISPGQFTIQMPAR